MNDQHQHDPNNDNQHREARVERDEDAQATAPPPPEENYSESDAHVPQKLNEGDLPAVQILGKLIAAIVLSVPMFLLYQEEKFRFWNMAQWDGVGDYIFGTVPLLFLIASATFFIRAILRCLSFLGSKISVTMKPHIQLGETAKLQWEVTGNPWKVVHLELELQCIKTVTRGSGKGRRTKRTTLVKTPLFQRNGTLGERTGELSVTIPADAPVSSSKEENDISTEIDWQIFVKVRTENLPACRMKFEFSVERPPAQRVTPNTPT